MPRSFDSQARRAMPPPLQRQPKPGQTKEDYLHACLNDAHRTWREVHDPSPILQPSLLDEDDHGAL
jgi:hypothetical protein